MSPSIPPSFPSPYSSDGSTSPSMVRATFVGFRLTEKLHESAGSVVYRALDEGTSRPVVLKVLRDPLPSSQALVRYKHEFDVVASLTFPGALRVYELRPWGRSAFIVMEDFGGTSLRDILARRRLPLREVLQLSIHVAHQLGAIHGQGIVHKDICPGNIVWNEATGDLKIIDFGISSPASHEAPGFEGVGAIVGTLAYLAPEQTGRMNRTVDYRADYYSLGATLYELSTGQPPFAGRDALELVHCHLARTPRPLNEVDPTVPTMLARITAKLLMKGVDERYQSMTGLLHDLERCRMAVEEQRPVALFAVGETDVPETLQMSQKLYGREEATTTLLEAFSRVERGGKELVLVGGPSGVGKTAVVQELHRPITRRNGFFIRGKYGQLQRDIPHSALLSAFRMWVQQLLSEEQSVLLRWRERILSAVEGAGGVLTEWLPDLEKIMGPQPSVKEAGAVEGQSRFHHVFRKFVGVLGAEAHPLVLFLDDLQWADAASLRLLEVLLTNGGVSHVLVIGAYRDNEVDPVHPVMMSVRAIERENVPVVRVDLAPLTQADTSAWLSDSLRLSPDLVAPLAQIVMKKTRGNPFFALQFLKRLGEHRFLRFESKVRRWVWDIPTIEAQGFTDNVVDFVVGHLRGWPAETQRALSLGALLGGQFSLRHLALALGWDEASAFAALRPALVEGIVATASPLRSTSATDPSAPLVADELRFMHDRLHQAAAALIPPSDLEETHLALGRQLGEGLTNPDLDREKMLFDVVGHLNVARNRIVDFGERSALARLNVEAGERALASQAPEAAVRYFAFALEEEDRLWDEDPVLAFRATLERARAEVLTGHAEQGERMALRLLELVNARLGGDRLFRAQIYALLIRVQTTTARYAEARVSATEILKEFAIELPVQHEGEAIAPLMERIEGLLAHRPLASLVDLPETSDRAAAAAMDLLNEVSPPAYFIDGNLFAVVGLNVVVVALEHGLTRNAAIGFAMYALVLRIMEKPTEAADVGRVAMAMADRFGDPSQQAQTYNVYGAHIGGWVTHVRSMHAILERGCQLGLLGGVPEFSGFNINNQLMNELFEGRNLDGIRERALASATFCARQATIMSLDIVEAVALAVTNLTGKTRGPFAFHLGDREEESLLAQWESHRSFYALVSFFTDRGMIRILYGDAEGALQDLSRAEPLLAFAPGNLIVAKHTFWYALAHALTDAAVEPEARPQHRAKLSALSAKLHGWAELCPANFRHMAHLVDAERARLEGDATSALAFYDEALADAAAQGFLHHEAWGQERIADYWMARGRPEYAASHLLRAHQGFEQWGAAFKAAELMNRYPELIRPRGLPMVGTLSTKESVALSTHVLDVLSVAKATQAISREMVLDQLLATLMRVVLQNAGAQRGALLVVEGEDLFVDAEGTLEPDAVTVGQHLPFSAWQGGAKSVVQYVLRTEESVVVGAAEEDPRFAHDPHFATGAARSVLCLPIVKQGAPMALLYLAHGTAYQAFSSERVAFLKILAGQVAVSLENARLLLREQRARAQAESAVKARDEFLLVASHELRTPMTSVLLMVQGLLKGVGKWQAPPSVVTALERASRQSQRLARLIEELLDVTRLQEGMLPILPEEVDLRALLEDLVRRMEPEFERVGSRLVFEGPASVPGSWDPSRMEQVVSNLLGNALKFCQAKPVVVRLSETQGAARIEVEDHGIGIAPDWLPRVFERFSRGVSERNYGGLGLGLYIAKSIVEAHGGTLRVHSELGKGALFVVDVPLRCGEGADNASVPFLGPAGNLGGTG